HSLCSFVITLAIFRNSQNTPPLYWMKTQNAIYGEEAWPELLRMKGSDRGNSLPLSAHRDTSLISRHCRSMTVTRRMPARASTAVALRAYRSSRGDFLSPLTPPYMPFGIRRFNITSKHGAHCNSQDSL